MFWTVVFWASLVWGFLVPPFWLLAGFAAFMTFLPKKERPQVIVPITPCPRCANNHVSLMPKSTFYYFTCGWCGARGWYPFETREEREMARHP